MRLSRSVQRSKKLCPLAAALYGTISPDPSLSCTTDDTTFAAIQNNDLRNLSNTTQLLYLDTLRGHDARILLHCDSESRKIPAAKLQKAVSPSQKSVSQRLHNHDVAAGGWR